MTREFVSTASFNASWRSLGLTEEDKIRLESMILQDPKIGDVIRGTGGVRKVRFAFEHRGKRGSMRVIYVDFELYEKVYLLTVYQKSNKENLTQQERNTIKRMVEALEDELRRR